MKVLVTGGAGYIGSHVVLNLLDQGYKVSVIDNLSTGHISLIHQKADFIECNINETEKIESLIKKNNFDAIMHFAGYIQVEESIKFPKKYFSNNSKNSQIFFDTCIKNNLFNIIFSSTAAIYGNNNQTNKISENSKINPLNPYGLSKLETEKYLINYNLNKINYIILRYFNVAGADPKLRSGLISKKSTHLIKIASEVATGKRKKITIFGKDYDTFDGTAIRDYIHVSDLANIHIKCLNFLFEKKQSQIFNCGYGKGYSVKQVLDMANIVSVNHINFDYGPRRKGDATSLVSDTSKLKQMIDWKPKYNKLDFIIKTSIDWELKLKNEKFL